MSAPNQNVMWLITHKALEKQKAKYEAKLNAVEVELRQAKLLINGYREIGLIDYHYFCGKCNRWRHVDDCFTIDIDRIELFKEVWSDYNPFGECVCDYCYWDHNGPKVCMVCEACDEIKLPNDIKVTANCDFYDGERVVHYEDFCLDCHDTLMVNRWAYLMHTIEEWQ